MNCKVELAKREDLDAICKLIYDRCLWFAEKGVKGWNVASYPNKYDKNYFIEQMKINKLFVAKADDYVCGAMLLKEEGKSFWENEDDSFYIQHLVTAIHLKGIGKELIEYVKVYCKENNKKYLRLDCYKESVFLNSYYQKIGFHNVGSGTKGNYNYNLYELNI